MSKKSAPALSATTPDDMELPQTAVRPSSKEILMQQMQSKLAEFMEPENAEPDPNKPKTLTDEETYAKRYGDLRRHSQKKEKEFHDKISNLEAQLEQLTRAANQPMPKTKEEFEAWKTKYPDIASFVEIIADEKASLRAQQLQDELSGVKQKLGETEKEKAYATLKALVPELEDIVKSVEYATWFSDQPNFVQDELNTSDDPYRIAYHINAFKLTLGKPTKVSKSTKLDALDTSVRNTGATPTRSGTTYKFTQSQIGAMQGEEYEAKEAEIIAARKAGLILDDVSKRNTVFDI